VHDVLEEELFRGVLQLVTVRLALRFDRGRERSQNLRREDDFEVVGFGRRGQRALLRCVEAVVSEVGDAFVGLDLLPVGVDPQIRSDRTGNRSGARVAVLV